MKKITTIKNYRSNIEVFYTENGEDGHISFYLDNYINCDEPTMRGEEEEYLADRYNFDRESLRNLLDVMEMNDWIQTEETL